MGTLPDHRHDHGATTTRRRGTVRLAAPPPTPAGPGRATPAPPSRRTASAELDCATEERELRDALEPLAGVHELAFDLVARRVSIAHTLADPAPLATAIGRTGMRATEVAAPTTARRATGCRDGSC